MVDPDIADIYADGVALSVGPFGMTISLYLSEPPDPDFSQPQSGGPVTAAAVRLVGRVRVSTALASELSKSIALALDSVPAPVSSKQ